MQLSKGQAIQFLANVQVSRSYFEKAEPATAEKPATQGRWIVEGYASTDDLDAQGHVVSEEAIKMGAASLNEYNTVLYNHDMNRPIGLVEKSEAHGTNLFIKVAISKSEPSIWEKIKDGTLSKFSIRGRVTAAEPVKKDGSDEEILVIKGMELFEVSVVSVPANVKARALSWYIEKSISELGKDKVWSILKGGEPAMEKKVNIANIESALSALAKASDDLEAQEDKDQVGSVSRALTALRERLSSGKSVEVVPEVAPVKTEIEPAPVANAAPAVEGLSEIVSQLQSLAKMVVEKAEQTEKALSSMTALKDEIAKMSTEITAVADKFSIRKGQGPANEEPVRTTQVVTDPVAELKKTDGFKKMKPGDKLQAVLEAATSRRANAELI